jgi:hypothetical protein
VPKGKPGSEHEAQAPGDQELADLLGKSTGAFRALTRDRAGATCEWRRYRRKSPWVMKVSEGERTLYYLTPQATQFEVTVVLGERATQAALAGRVSKELHSVGEALCRGSASARSGRRQRRSGERRGVGGGQLEPRSTSTVAHPSRVDRRRGRRQS